VASPSAHSQIAVQKQGYLPYNTSRSNYRSHALKQSGGPSAEQIDQGEIKLSTSPLGYLQSVLENLRIPVSSQTLSSPKPASSTRRSRQRPRVHSTSTMKSMWAFVHDGKALELFPSIEQEHLLPLDTESAAPGLPAALSSMHASTCPRRTTAGVLYGDLSHADRDSLLRAPCSSPDRSPIKDRGMYVTALTGLPD